MKYLFAWLYTLVALLLVFSGATYSQPKRHTTALEMYSWCDAIDKAQHKGQGILLITPSFEAGKCWGAFSMLQRLSAVQFIDDAEPALSICVSPESTLVQHVMIFRKFVYEHPEQAHEDYAEVALRSLWNAFSCGR